MKNSEMVKIQKIVSGQKKKFQLVLWESSSYILHAHSNFLLNLVNVVFGG